MTFFLTKDSACPYLNEKQNCYITTDLDFIDIELTTRLSQSGFRRANTAFYRPACKDCNACISIRIKVDNFQSGKSFNRIAQKNKNLSSIAEPLHYHPQHYQIFNEYITSRHNDGSMFGMTEEDYQQMVLLSSAETYLHSLYDNQTLLASCVTDIFEDGLSAVYSYFSPNYPKNSLGTYLILSLINACQKEKLPYLYLGYWVKDSPKMSYKTRFQPLEYYYDGHWHESEPDLNTI